jgi:hypothetical protein
VLVLVHQLRDELRRERDQEGLQQQESTCFPGSRTSLELWSAS